MEQTDADRKALEEFVVGNADLEKLEAMLDGFNIFEAVGMSRQEIRHSMFLSFLLNPNQPHGMDDAFLKRFLQSAVSGSTSAVVTPIELSLWNLDGVGVQREWNYIDIFLLDDENRLTVIIENKIGSKEHSGQLERYYDLVREQYPDYKILAIYLTPNGDEPSHSEYLPLDYGTVCRTLDEVRQSKSSVMEPDAKVLIRHYTDMMRRNIVGDSEIARLAQQIYQKHQRAIDLIYEQRFADKDLLGKLLVSLIKNTPNFDYRSRTVWQTSIEFINFDYKGWSFPTLQEGNSKPVLSFGFANRADSLDLKLYFHSVHEEVRDKVFQLLYKDVNAFHRAGREAKELQFFRPMLPSEFYEVSTTMVEREAEIRRNWNDFLENDLPRIDAALRAEEWIWEDAPEPAAE